MGEIPALPKPQPTKPTHLNRPWDSHPSPQITSQIALLGRIPEQVVSRFPPHLLNVPLRLDINGLLDNFKTQAWINAHTSMLTQNGQRVLGFVDSMGEDVLCE